MGLRSAIRPSKNRALTGNWPGIENDHLPRAIEQSSVGEVVVIDAHRPAELTRQGPPSSTFETPRNDLGDRRQFSRERIQQTLDRS